MPSTSSPGQVVEEGEMRRDDVAGGGEVPAAFAVEEGEGTLVQRERQDERRGVAHRWVRGVSRRPARRRSRPATHHQRAPGQEAEVPGEPLLARHRLVHVVEAEDLVVDRALHEVEEPEAEEDRARQELARPADMRVPPGAPEDHEARDGEDVGAGVEDAVPEGVDLQVLDGVRRIARARDEMVPLQQLVQHDAVEEPAEAEAQQDAGGDRKGARVHVLHLASATRFVAVCFQAGCGQNDEGRRCRRPSGIGAEAP
jgi:hypothetical protein